MIQIVVSLWDSGCLPNLLEREINAAKRRYRAIGNQLSTADKGNLEAYLNQLHECLDAVRKARAAQK